MPAARPGTEMLAPEVTCTPDRDTAYEVTIDGKQYKQQVFTFWSKTWVCDYCRGSIALPIPDSVPEGTRIVDMNNRDITTITTEGTGDGYAGQVQGFVSSGKCAGRNRQRPALFPHGRL